MQALAPPQMMEIEAVGAIASLWVKRSIAPHSAASGQGPRSSASFIEASSHLAADVLEHAQVPGLRHRGLHRNALGLQEGVEAHHAEADRALAHGASIGRARHVVRRAVDEVVSTLSRKRITSSMKVLSLLHSSQVSRLSEDRQHTAVRSLPWWSTAGRQGDFRTQIGGRDLQTQGLLMVRHVAVHGIDEQQVGLAGLQAGLENLLPQRARVNALDLAVILGAAQGELGRRRAPPA